jgi:hypothetical protein
MGIMPLKHILDLPLVDSIDVGLMETGADYSIF